MSRPLSWYPLAGFDPVPGDPAEVLEASRAYATIAEAIAGAAAGLKSTFDSDGHESQALDEVHTQAKAVAADIEKAYERYRAVADALAAFANPLDRAQTESLAALAEAKAAQRAIDEAHHTMRTTDWDGSGAATSAGGTSLVPVDNPGLAALRAGLSAADRRLDRARQRLADAVHDRDVAAARAVAAIQGVTGDDGLRDSFWRNTLHVTHWVSDVFGAISMWAGVLALATCWIPIVGEVLGAVALIAGAIALVADIVLLFSGEGDWLDVTFGALGLMTFGLGRVVGAGLKITIRGARAAEATAKAERAAEVAGDLGANVDALGKPTEAIEGFTAVGPAAMADGPVTKALSAAGFREMLSTLKPSAITSDLGETFAKVGKVEPKTFTPDRTEMLGAVIGDADSAEALTNLNKSANTLSGNEAFSSAYSATQRALGTVGTAIALDEAVLGASAAYVLVGSDPVAGLELAK
ncbi:hypothetical protein [Cellulomonas sp.]|uniref:hypothetical protein n=1 Tax=Cellulomonas sp. TaxID=40001 RepID=UPI001AFD5E1F|nr:hypothetical protein [Cellulomonas sp.]MBO9553605.1 hypothetical protein [Cellulomonas sp.]